MFKDRFVFRNRDAAPSALRARRIAVTGTGECVGATFVAAGLCMFFAENGLKVSYTEVGNPGKMRRLIYESAALDKRIGPERVKSVYRAVKEKSPVNGAGDLHRAANVSGGISWRVITPEDAAENMALDEGEAARLIATADGMIQVFDVAADEAFDGCLLDMDAVIAVADPMPSKLMRQQDRIRMLKRLEAAGNRVIWLINRMNDGVSRRQIQGFLREEQVLYMEEMPAETVYTAEFRCMLPHGDREIMEKSEGVFTKISQTLGI